jgi:hypothetical protein
MAELKISSPDKITIYLEGKGRFAKKISETKWIIKWKDENDPDVRVTIYPDKVTFECDNTGAEEFYISEFRNYDPSLDPVYL